MERIEMTLQVRRDKGCDLLRSNYKLSLYRLTEEDEEVLYRRWKGYSFPLNL